MVHIPPELPEASPIIISMTETHCVIAVELSRATLAQLHVVRLLERLLDFAVTTGPPDD
jgi:hypothetical protein